jgi:DNA polymerase-1
LPTKGLSKTSKGEISTQEVDLIKIANLHPIINLILEYRQINKLLTTYINSLFLNYDSNTKRIFTNFNQTATTTGRIVSQNPNLQNLPLEGKLANSLRKCFVSEEGYYFVRADYSQIELRLLAHLSKDEALKAAFENNLDLHLQTAKMIFGEADQETRRKAKIINFSIIYGASAKTLSEKLQVPISEANKLIEKFFYFYPGVKKLKEDLIEFAKTYGYVQTLFGRKRFIPEINYQSYREKSFAERIAVNMPIQGLAADIFKKAMIEIDKEIYQKNLPAFFTLAIHDELVFEVKDEVKEEFADIIKKKMENVYSLDVPLVVNLSISNYLSSK